MPSSSTDRLYGLTTSVAVKAPCLLKTTANHALSGLDAIDDVTPVAGNRILVGSNTDSITNGIYTASAGAWTRATDFDGPLDGVTGTLVFVTSGTVGAAHFWRVTTAGEVVIGTSAITFEQEFGEPGATGDPGPAGPAGPEGWATAAAWLTATSYTATAPKSVVTEGGETYLCLTSHTSGVFATDLAAVRWIKLATKGADGMGAGTVTSVAELTLGTAGTDIASSVANPTTTPVITLNVPTASAANRGALSAANWSTFNNKAGTASPTFTGTPAAPTAPAGTNTTQIATTEFVTSVAIQSVTSSATVTPTFANDQVNITAQAVALDLANPTGAAIDGWGIVVRIKDNGTARAITYGSQYRAIGVTLPVTTVSSKTLYLGMVFNDADTKWDVVSVAQQA